MENNLIIKTKFQLIPVIMFVLPVVALKIYSYYDISIVFGWQPIIVNILIWLLNVLIVIFIFASLIIIIIKIIKKNSDYALLKKTSLILLELIILYFIFSGLGYHPSKSQVSAYIQKKNTLQVGKGVSQSEVDTIRLLFKDKSPSEIYANMQKGKFRTSYGDPLARQNNLLEIEKLDKECHYIGEDLKPIFNNCVEGDLYVKYGWDNCFPQSDCIGDTYFENYLIRSVSGGYKIIATF